MNNPRANAHPLELLEQQLAGVRHVYLADLEGKVENKVTTLCEVLLSE